MLNDRMKFYLCLLDCIPAFVCTDRSKAVAFIGKKKNNYIVPFEMDSGEKKPDIIYLFEDIYTKKGYYFTNLADAIIMANKKDVNEVYQCAVDDYEDPDIYKLSNLFQLPIHFISSMSITYRIYNGLDSDNSFKEALAIWHIFAKHNKEIIDQIIRCDDLYKEKFKDYCHQYELLSKNDFKNLDDFFKIYRA